MDRAITEAAEAIDRTIDAPKNDDRLSRARRAIGVAMEVILALDKEIGRSLRIRSRARRFPITRPCSSRKPSVTSAFASRRGGLAQAGYMVKIASSSDAETWLVDVEKGGRNGSFRVARNAGTPTWQEAVRRVLGLEKD